MCVLVNVDPIHNGGNICDGGDQAFVFGVWVRKIVASVKMPKRRTIFSTSVDP
jgi:hypothetical protein